jgi:MoaA/NifB/PqqE/SkfB family radical SAM enzyme
MTIHFFVAADPSGTALWLLHDQWSPCGLSCRFCPNTLLPRPPPLTDPVRRAAVLADVDALLSAPPRRVVLASADILEYPDLFEIIAKIRAHNLPITLVSPGWRLADRAFAEAVHAAGCTVDITYLSDDDATYARITGVPDARARVLAAVAQVRALGIPLRMSCTVNADNAPQLAETVSVIHRRFGVQRITVRWFFPDVADAPADYYGQFPSFELLQQALAKLDASEGSLPVLDLRNTALCQVDVRGLRRLQVILPPHTGEQNMYKAGGFTACRTCAQADRCVQIHPAYTGLHTPRPVDPELLTAAVALSRPPQGPPPTAGRLPGQGKLPGEGRPKGSGVLPGEGKLPGT